MQVLHFRDPQTLKSTPVLSYSVPSIMVLDPVSLTNDQCCVHLVIQLFTGIRSSGVLLPFHSDPILALLYPPQVCFLMFIVFMVFSWSQWDTFFPVPRVCYMKICSVSVRGFKYTPSCCCKMVRVLQGGPSIICLLCNVRHLGLVRGRVKFASVS